MAVSHGKVLQPATVQLLQTSQKLASGQESGYGLGWKLETLTLGGKMLSSEPDAGAGSVSAFAVKVSLASKMVTNQAYALDGLGHRLNGLALDPSGNVLLAGSVDDPGASTCAGPSATSATTS